MCLGLEMSATSRSNIMSGDEGHAEDVWDWRRDVHAQQRRFPDLVNHFPFSMSIRILVIGSGAREHALAWRLARSPASEHIFVCPGNPGTSAEPKTSNVDLPQADFDRLVQFALQNNVSSSSSSLYAALINRSGEPRRSRARATSRRWNRNSFSSRFAYQITDNFRTTLIVIKWEFPSSALPLSRLEWRVQRRLQKILWQGIRSPLLDFAFLAPHNLTMP